MATYKHPCIHCGAFIERDARFCHCCTSASPFGYQCPNCLSPVTKGQNVCANCGRPLYVQCPVCKARTFVQEACEFCGTSLLIKCGNPRCGVNQFFENTKCTACGKKLNL